MSTPLIDDCAEFDSITDLDEAKRCLKIAYRQGVNMYHGRAIAEILDPRGYSLPMLDAARACAKAWGLNYAD
jgi:hypothetical protein